MTVPQALGRLRVAMDRAYLEASREVGLTAQQAELLCAAMRPDAVTDLARVLRRDHSTISRLVDRAAKRGLLHRRGEHTDGRVSVIELTPKGHRLAKAFLTALEAKTQPLLATWPVKRQQSAVETLSALAAALEASAVAQSDDHARPRRRGRDVPLEPWDRSLRSALPPG
jgi:DNA-binding MarR family transcriptional regulator